jgi:Family of unknown function (DUF5681)
MTGKNKTDGRLGKKFNAADEKSYRVGYGRPPLATRFKPNQSGNPKGRPRRPLSLRAVVEKVLEEKIDVREGNRVLRMSNRQALARAALRRALNGDPKLLRALALMMRAEIGLEQPEDGAAAHVSASDEAILADFLARHGTEPDHGNQEADKSAEPPLPDKGSRKS